MRVPKARRPCESEGQTAMKSDGWRRTGIGFWLAFGALAWGCGTALAGEGGTWAAVQERAKASGEPKAVWRELKALTPDELLECCDSCAREAMEAGADATEIIIPVNAMLSYHKDKTGWGETAAAVGKIVAESDNPHLVYGALEWIENNDHWKEIPPEGFQAVAEGMLAALERPGQESAVFLIVLNQCGSEDIVGNFPEECLERVTARCGEILRETTDEKVRKEAGWSLQTLERIAEERDGKAASAPEN